MTCSGCNQEVAKPLEHLSECQLVDADTRQQAKNILAARMAYAKQEACCKLRKKLLLRPLMLPEEYCGVADAEVLDVLTFEKFQGIDVVCPRFCPWCGAPWKREGVNVL